MNIDEMITQVNEQIKELKKSNELVLELLAQQALLREKTHDLLKEMQNDTSNF